MIATRPLGEEKGLAVLAEKILVNNFDSFSERLHLEFYEDYIGHSDVCLSMGISKCREVTKQILFRLLHAFRQGDAMEQFNQFLNYNLRKRKEQGLTEFNLNQEQVMHVLVLHKEALLAEMEKSGLSESQRHQAEQEIDEMEPRFRELALKYCSAVNRIGYEHYKSKNVEMEKALRYAQMIQSKMMVKTTNIIHPKIETFLFYQPKDIVSGDFYHVQNTLNGTYVAMVIVVDMVCQEP